MSISSELQNLQTDITNARAAVVSKGGTATSGGGSSQLATDIATIPQTTVTSYTANANGTYNAPSGTAYGTFIVAIPVYNGEVV